MTKVPHVTGKKDSATHETAAHEVRWCAGTETRRTVIWLAGGILLATGMWLCVWARVTQIVSANALALASVAMGGLFMALLAVRPSRMHRWLWIAMIALAILMRLPWFLLPLSPGEDYCRYLWDGAVAAQGISPYRYAPLDVAEGRVDNDTISRLARDGSKVLHGINHPHLRTIYPPVAQAAFAAAYRVSPFGVLGLRIVWLFFDALAALAVVGLLLKAGRPRSLAFIYLWNPLLVTESYGGCHVDLLAAALVALFAWMLVSRRPVLASLCLALSVGVKLWPLVLLPFLVRRFWGHKRQLFVSLLVLSASISLLFIPFVHAFGSRADSGLLTYARTWSAHWGAYRLVGYAGWALRSWLNLGIEGHYVGRGLLLLTYIPILLWLGLRKSENPGTLCRRMGLALLVLLLLGPVLWPWYVVALIPLAAVAKPRFSLLLPTVLLPLCYLDSSLLSAWCLIWLVHVPIWITLFAEGVHCTMRETSTREPDHV